MTVNEILEILDNNYEEMDVFEFISDWTKQNNSYHDDYALYSRGGNIIVQAIMPYPSTPEESIEATPIHELYIGYEEDPDRIIHKAYREIPDAAKKVTCSNFIQLDLIMGWN